MQIVTLCQLRYLHCLDIYSLYAYMRRGVYPSPLDTLRKPPPSLKNRWVQRMVAEHWLCSGGENSWRRHCTFPLGRQMTTSVFMGATAKIKEKEVD